MFEILVIDDEANPRQSWFRASLEGLGFTVASAHSSVEAYELLRERKFHVAFFDHDLGKDHDTGSSIATRILMDPDTYHCPQTIWVHSANPVGAANIASKFRSMDVPTRVLDFGVILSTPIERLLGLINDLVAEGTNVVEKIKHRYELGTVVEVDVCIQMSGEASVEVDLKGTCRLVVVGHIRGADQEPLYILSDLAVKYPKSCIDFAPEKVEYKYVATLVEFGYAEDDLRPTGEVLPLKESVDQWLDQQHAI